MLILYALFWTLPLSGRYEIEPGRVSRMRRVIAYPTLCVMLGGYAFLMLTLYTNAMGSFLDVLWVIFKELHGIPNCLPIFYHA